MLILKQGVTGRDLRFSLGHEAAFSFLENVPFIRVCCTLDNRKLVVCRLQGASS